MNTQEYLQKNKYKKYITVDKYDQLRIYHKSNFENSFEFVVLMWVSNIIADESWGDTSKSEILYSGNAYFDGIRHLYCGDELTDNEGYLYYPEIKNQIKIFEGLLKLEENYGCNDY